MQASKKLRSGLPAVAALAALALSLAGCVVYPNNGYYGGGYAYAPPPPVYYAAPPVAFDFGFGGGWGHHWR